MEVDGRLEFSLHDGVYLRLNGSSLRGGTISSKPVWKCEIGAVDGLFGCAGATGADEKAE